MLRTEVEYAEVRRLYATGLPITEVARLTTIPAITITEYLRRNKLSRSSSATRELNMAGCSQIPSTISFLPLKAETAYVLGLIYGDGSLDKKGTYFRVFSGDEDVLQVVNRVMGGRLRIAQSGPGKCKVVNANSRRLYRELQSFGLIHNKCHRLVYPDIPESLEPHFVRGLLDSDGCWSTRLCGSRSHLMFVYISVCREFVERLRETLVRLVGVNPKVSVGAPATKGFPGGGPSYRLAYGHRDSVRLGEWLYGDSEGLRCARKFATWDAGRQLEMETLSEDQIADAIDRYRSGGVAREIAQSLGVDESTIYHHLRKHQVPRRHKHCDGFSVPREKREELVRRYLAGESMRKIAREVGYSYGGAFKALSAMGIRSDRRPAVAASNQSRSAKARHPDNLIPLRAASDPVASSSLAECEPATT